MWEARFHLGIDLGVDVSVEVKQGGPQRDDGLLVDGAALAEEAHRLVPDAPPAPAPPLLVRVS